MRRIRPSLTYANVTATIALFLVLGGTSLAARQMITGKDVANGTIGSKDLTKGLRKAIAKAAKPGPQGPAGQAGSPGERGERGPAGPALGTYVEAFYSSGSEVTLSGSDQTVATTEEFLPNTTGVGGGPVQLPSAGGFWIEQDTVRVERVAAAGAFECALQRKRNQGPYFDVDRVATVDQVLRFSASDGNGLNLDVGAARFNYRVVCKGAGVVKVAKLSAIVVYRPPSS